MNVTVKFLPPIMEVFRLLGMQSFNYNNRTPKSTVTHSQEHTIFISL
jgi:hypothetical protein